MSRLSNRLDNLKLVAIVRISAIVRSQLSRVIDGSLFLSMLRVLNIAEFTCNKILY